MKLGNIEEFFNKNFFKKTRRVGGNSQASTNGDQFGGVPESHYEPSTTWQDNLSNRHQEKEHDFHPGFTTLTSKKQPTDAQGFFF